MNEQLNLLGEETIPQRIILIQDSPGMNQKRIRVIDDYGTTYQNVVTCVVCDNNPDLVRVIVDGLKRLFMVEREFENGTYNPGKAFTNGFKY